MPIQPLWLSQGDNSSRSDSCHDSGSSNCDNSPVVAAAETAVEGTAVMLVAAVEGTVVMLLTAIEGTVVMLLTAVEGIVVMLSAVEGTVVMLVAAVEGTVVMLSAVKGTVVMLSAVEGTVVMLSAVEGTVVMLVAAVEAIVVMWEHYYYYYYSGSSRSDSCHASGSSSFSDSPAVSHLIGQQNSQLALLPLEASADGDQQDGLAQRQTSVLEQVTALFIIHIGVGHEHHKQGSVHKGFGHLVHRGPICCHPTAIDKKTNL